MSDSISDILGKKDFKEPPEIQAVKQFVSDKFGEIPSVKLTDSAIIIGVSSSALAGALRPEIHKLAEQLNTKKRLVLRIG